MPYAFSRTIFDVLCTFRHFHNLIFHQSARGVYLGLGVKVGSLFWSVRNFINLVAITFSNIFEKAGKMLMGLKLSKLCLSPDLNMGITIAIFMLCGTIPELRDLFIIGVRGIKI